MKEAVVAIVAVWLFIAGVIVGKVHASSAQDQFQAMTSEQRVDFIYAMATPEIRRAIAEDWCAINRKTRGVCGRARMVAPVGGGR